MKWQQAMQVELDALEANNIWEMMSLPAGKYPIGCKWVYKVKYKADRLVERHKARLLAKGFAQQLGIDYVETFSPVARMTSIRLIFAVAAAKGYLIHHLDINNAFYYVDLHEEVYMTPPQGFKCKACQAYKSNKSIYRLKQVSRQWNAKQTGTLLSMGFHQSWHD